VVANGGGVPAGWYPDPLGLQQLRWWDGAAWTESTSDVPGAPDEAARPSDGVGGAAGGPTEAGSLEEAGGAGAASVAVVPEPFAPAESDPFAVAEANAVVFTSRRARRDYERRRALESGTLGAPVESPYARLDTNPVDIRLAGEGIAPGAPQAAIAVASVTERADTELVGDDPLVDDPVEPGPVEPDPAAMPIDTRASDLSPSDPSPSSLRPSDARFSLDVTRVAETPAPDRAPIPKASAPVTAVLLAALLPLTVLALVAVRWVPGLEPSPQLAWGVCAGAYVIGLLLAFLDSSRLRRGGHARTASPLWELLTPIGYLSARGVATRRETGGGRVVILTMVLGVLVALLLVVLFPDVITLVAPDVTVPWSSFIG